MFEPTLTQLDPLLALDQNVRLDALKVTPGEFNKYSRRSTLNAEHQLKIKLPLNGEGDWKFSTSDPTFTPDTALLQPGAPLTLTLTAGMYFDEGNDRYGVFYTLKHLDLKPEEEGEGGALGPAPPMVREAVSVA